MSNSNNPNEHDNRNLSDVFKELQDIQRANINSKKARFKNNKQPKVSNISSTNSFHNSDLKLSHIIIGCSILIVSITLLFPTHSAFTQSYAREDNYDNSNNDYELNRHRLNMQEIISYNYGDTIVKTQLEEEREVEFETTYNDNHLLPRGEEIVLQEGVNGKDKFSVVQTFENDIFIEEIIFERNVILEPVPKIIDLGTSDFLAKHNAHIGDTLYLSNNATLKSEPNEESEDIADISQYLDVKILDLPNEEWCKVSFGNIEGFIKTSDLTSPTITPSILEKNRIHKVLITLNIDLEINKPSGLTLNDYEKIFSNLPKDTNDVFKNNYQVFYTVEKKYNINGIALAAIAIHESNWGTSEISVEKYNLFGYGAYDSTPFESSYTFDSYADGIDTVARSLVKYYINPAGTKIYDGETAEAWYYNGPTLRGINTRYATDDEWFSKVYSHIETLYTELK